MSKIPIIIDWFVKRLIIILLFMMFRRTSKGWIIKKTFPQLGYIKLLIRYYLTLKQILSRSKLSKISYFNCTIDLFPNLILEHVTLYLWFANIFWHLKKNYEGVLKFDIKLYCILCSWEMLGMVQGVSSIFKYNRVLALRSFKRMNLYEKQVAQSTVCSLLQHSFG